MPILAADDKTKATSYFESNYDYKYYGNLNKVLLNEVRKKLRMDNDADDGGYREKDAQIILMKNWMGVGTKPKSVFVIPSR